MAAGLGFKTFVSGEVLTAADTNGYLMQGILVFASASARNAAITSPQEGQYCYLKDTNSTEYYDGAAWVSGVEGDISGVTAGTGISGGGTSGTVTVTNSMATAIDAKGDLIAGTGADAFSRLAVGSNGETLVADSGAATGLRYSATPSASNPILNSAFQNWQRGTSIAVPAASSAYAADRFQVYNAGASEALTISRQATGDTTNLPFIQYCTRFQRNSGQTGTTLTQYGQTLESVNSIPFAGKAVTFSFYARKGADFSASSNTLATSLTTGTGTDQNLFTGFTGATSPINSTATLTATWQRFTFTGTIAATATQLGFQTAYTPVGTAGTNDYYEVTGFQIDIGSVALPFRTYAATIQGELSACQRYYERFTIANDAPICNTSNYNTTLTFGALPFLVEKRVTPTVTPSSATMLKLLANGTTQNSTAAAADAITTKVAEIRGTYTAIVTGQAGWYRANGATFIEVSAEL